MIQVYNTNPVVTAYITARTHAHAWWGDVEYGSQLYRAHEYVQTNKGFHEIDSALRASLSHIPNLTIDTGCINGVFTYNIQETSL